MSYDGVDAIHCGVVNGSTPRPTVAAETNMR
jgi:hypothetical protein